MVELLLLVHFVAVDIAARGVTMLWLVSMLMMLGLLVMVVLRLVLVRMMAGDRDGHRRVIETRVDAARATTAVAVRCAVAAASGHCSGQPKTLYRQTHASRATGWGLAWKVLVLGACGESPSSTRPYNSGITIASSRTAPGMPSTELAQQWRGRKGVVRKTRVRYVKSIEGKRRVWSGLRLEHAYAYADVCADVCACACSYAYV